ncbi:Hypothetical predicted protein [Podarcis lilfordi]|uniref:Uncharacterized protein n=1 Tax=Podarcis lilfordi TaxID=74358 RepID=A0AA35PSJ8_9SAUR|nr:Hypothetical predicted protein [Podarcis lilfordi]
MPATLREQRQRCRCSRRGPRAWARWISARAGFGMPATLRGAAAALPLLAERSAKPGRADLSARRLRHAGNSPRAAAALPLLAERSASLGALTSARAGFGMPATLREQRQRCRCSRRGPRSLGALTSARAGSACRQLSASSGSAAAARGEVREAWAR